MLGAEPWSIAFHGVCPRLIQPVLMPSADRFRLQQWISWLLRVVDFVVQAGHCLDDIALSITLKLFEHVLDKSAHRAL
jgi:hypothetical protein